MWNWPQNRSNLCLLGLHVRCYDVQINQSGKECPQPFSFNEKYNFSKNDLSYWKVGETSCSLFQDLIFSRQNFLWLTNDLSQISTFNCEKLAQDTWKVLITSAWSPNYGWFFKSFLAGEEFSMRTFYWSMPLQKNNPEQSVQKLKCLAKN